MRKVTTPEEQYKDPNNFYNEDEASRYNSNSGMKNTQIKLTKISLELAKLDSDKNKKILDIGCGTGFSLDYLRSLGYKNIEGIDPSKEMIKIAKQKKLNVKLGGFEDLKRITEKYDLIISISSLQWVTANKNGLELKNLIKKIGKEIHRLLKSKGVAIIQFYPFSESVFYTILSSFSRINFLSVEEFIYNKESIKKRKYFIILKK